jgi:hypothetical protein
MGQTLFLPDSDHARPRSTKVLGPKRSRATSLVRMTPGGPEVAPDQRVMRIRLLRKLAEVMDGIDLSRYEEGDEVNLPQQSAELLIAEGWGEPIDRRGARRHRESDDRRISSGADC